MISKTLKIFAAGLRQIYQNFHFLLVAILLVLIPGIFIWISQIFLDISYQNVNSLQNKSISLVHSALEIQMLANDTDINIQNYLASLVTIDSTITTLKILDSELSIINSANPEEIGTTETEADMYASSAIAPNNSFILNFKDSDSRKWQAFREVKLSEKTLYIFSEHDLSLIDGQISAAYTQVYLLLPVVYLFLILLAIWIVKQAAWQKRGLELTKKVDEQMLFTDTLAHELRAPLTGMRGYTSFLLESHNLSPEENKFAENIDTSTKRLISLVNDFLEVARIQSNKLKFIFSEIDVIQVVRSVETEFKNILEEKGLKLKVSVPANPVFAKTDRDRLHQILANLLSNAIKYTQRGAVELTLTQTKLKTVISISDTGNGISAEDQKKLFEPFSRVGSSIESGSTGTGLGMWITKQLVEKLNGKIFVESIEGVGTRVKLVFDA